MKKAPMRAGATLLGAGKISWRARNLARSAFIAAAGRKYLPGRREAAPTGWPGDLLGDLLRLRPLREHGKTAKKKVPPGRENY